MKSTATANAANTPEVTYPRLVQRQDGAIALFIDENMGTIVHTNRPAELGEHSEFRDINHWKPYIGTVTLESK